MLKFQKYISFILLSLSLSFAAIPSGYYDTASGKTGTDLRLALHNIIDGHTQKTYDDAWVAFQTTDAKANGKIWDMYTGIEWTYQTDQQGYEGDMDQYTNYNREHSWPKSWANETYPMYSDMFHLYPVQANANTNRSNLPYGEVDPAQVTYTTDNGTRKGAARSGLGYSGTVFEPIDEYKGDLARTYFYMSTRYYTEDSGWDSSEMTIKSEIRDWAMDMLLDWHHLDAVSQKELDRNEAVYVIQGNRNPFIDNPDYADSIWTSSDTSSGPPPPEPTSLSPGDIAITGVNMVNPDQISVVFLVDIADGTEIKFTDNGWKSTNEWRTGEGTHTWTASSAYNAGDEIVIDLSGPLLSTSGDQVIAYQNTSDMIAAINNEGSHVWQADATTSNTSALPQGLTNGTNCVALDETDNIQYDRSVISGSKEEILAAINDYTNWSGNNSTPLSLSTAGFTITEEPLPIKLGYFDAQEDQGVIRLSWRTETETNNSHFIIYRNGAPLASIPGAGTTSEPRSYSFIDRNVVPGKTYTYILADVDYANTETKYEDEAVSITLANDLFEADFVVGAAYPNPFNPRTVISMEYAVGSNTVANIYNTQGVLVDKLINGFVEAGHHNIIWDASNMTSGVYILQVLSGDVVNTQKLVLMK